MITYPFETPPAAGESIVVAPGIRWIRMPLPFKLDHINLWLLEDALDGVDGWTIVDTGYASSLTHSLWEKHISGAMGRKPVHRIIVTHYHPDHVGCAAWLHEKTRAPVWMTASEFLSAHAAAGDFAGFDRENSGLLFMTHGLAKVRPNYGVAQKERADSYKRGVPSVPTRYVRIMEGDEFEIGIRRWKVKTVFGHAPEHATLFSADDNILISGDQVLPRITTNVGVWGNQPEANPLALFLKSLREFESLPENTLVLPSHDRVFSGLHSRLQQLQEHHQARLDELLAALSTPKCAAEVLSVLFKRELDDHQLVFAMGETIAHLHYLWKCRQALRSNLDGIFYFVRVGA